MQDFIASDYDFEQFTGKIFRYNLPNFLAVHTNYVSRSTSNVDDCYCGEVPISGGSGIGSGGATNPVDGSPSGGSTSGGGGSVGGNPFSSCQTYTYVSGCGGSNSDRWHLHSSCGNQDTITQTMSVLVCGGEPDTFLQRQTTEDDCNNPCDDSGGGVMSIELPIDMVADPCKDIKDLIDSNTNIKLRFKELLNNNSNNESGFQIRKNPTTGENIPSNLKISTGQYHIHFNYDDYTLAVAHKHSDGTDDGFEMFSGHDVLNLAELSENYTGIDNNLSQTFTVFLVVSGQTYALKINDAESLSTLKRFNSTLKKKRDFHEDLIEFYERDVNVTTGTDSNASEQVQRLFQFLEDKEINANLSKAVYNTDNEIENWKTYNPDTNEYTNCN